MEGGIENIDTVKKAVEGQNAIYHLAAFISVPLSLKKPYLSSQVNIEGTLHLLEEGRKAGVEVFIFSSSSAVYGDGPEDWKSEDLKPAPISLYGTQKLTGEHYLSIYSQIYSLATISLRYFNVFGPRQNPDSQYAAVIPKFIQRMIEGKPPIIYGTGEQSRDFIFVKDVVQANLKAGEKAQELSGGCFNIGLGQRVCLLDLVTEINQILKTSFEPVFEPPREGDILHSAANIKKSQEKLSFEPQYTFTQGLEETIQWFLNNKK